MDMSRIRFTVLLMTFFFSVVLMGQTPAGSDGRERVLQFAEHFEEVEGVDAMVCVKGSGLGRIKMMLRGKVDKEFIAGVEMVVILDYTNASKDVVAAVQCRIGLDGHCKRFGLF